jgi:thiamine-phosphate pyrophosphorylase
MNNKQNLLPKELLRVIDANLNRLKEGIRVIEDIMRYSYNNKELSSKLKKLRHLAVLDITKELLTYRDSINDVLKQSTKTELNRVDLQHILLANFKRAEESCRVLEEVFKLNNNSDSEKFKQIRYELYNLEKEVILPL